MKVRMTKTAAGPGGVLMSGKVYDIPEQEAKSLVAAKAAIFLKKPMAMEPAQEEEQGQAKEETASIEPEEKAVKPKGEPKKGKQKDVKK